ncbi:MAG: formyltransferase family protein [Bacteroidota bacterium]
MRIVFMGTPTFSIPTLDTLVQAGYEIGAVVTAPDKPAGRGNKLKPSPIKTYALEKGLPLLQPVKLRDPAFIQALEDIAPDLMVVVAFRMLPQLTGAAPR